MKNEYSKTEQPCTIQNVGVRYFYKGMLVNDSCSKCNSQNINTYTSDWLRMEKMNRKECMSCGNHWLINVR